MTKKSQYHNQRGFSIVEMMVSITVMIVFTGAVFSLVRDTMKVSTASYELTDAQEVLRISQEYVNRDLMNAGDGLKSISTIRVPTAFVTSYLTRNAVTDPGMPAGATNLGILLSDNDVPASTNVTGSNPAETVLPNTDRHTMLQMDRDFVQIALPANAITSTGSQITVSAADISRFTVGEVYFLTSALGATLGAITSINTGTRVLSFSNGDSLGLNLTGASGHITAISSAGTIPTSLMRMKIIHYYINSKKHLVRRVFGVKGGGFTERVIAEHVTSVQFQYALNMLDAGGNIVQPTQRLQTLEQQRQVRQVEVTVTAETPHAIATGTPLLSSTASTSVRNMQFKQALQPTAGG